MFLYLLLACTDPQPVPLPPRTLTAATSRGRMVRIGDVQGFLARPQGADDPAPTAVLQLITTLDPSSRERATAKADQGLIVLAVPHTVPTDAAAAYLKGMPPVQEIVTECYRTSCP